LEHWPPKRYLKDLADRTNKHLVWAICRKHNTETSNFIKSLTPITPESRRKAFTRQDTDPYLLYRVCANYWYVKFIRAFEIKDRAAAEAAISNVLGYWFTVKSYPPRPSIARGPSARMQHVATSGRRHSTWDSQLT
jgi:hypothetical protein